VEISSCEHISALVSTYLVVLSLNLVDERVQLEQIGVMAPSLENEESWQSLNGKNLKLKKDSRH